MKFLLILISISLVNSISALPGIAVSNPISIFHVEVKEQINTSNNEEITLSKVNSFLSDTPKEAGFTTYLVNDSTRYDNCIYSWNGDELKLQHPKPLNIIVSRNKANEASKQEPQIYVINFW